MHDLEVLLEVLVRPEPLRALVAPILLLLLIRMRPHMRLEVRVPPKRVWTVRAMERTLDKSISLRPRRSRKTHLARVRTQMLLDRKSTV